MQHRLKPKLNVRPRRHCGGSVRGGAFTTVELLVVIGIIVVLAGIIFIGLGKVTGSAKDRVTRQQLANLKGMLADYEAQTRFATSPPAWLWWNGATVVNAPSAVYQLGTNAYPINFWRDPYRVNNDPAERSDPVANPGLVTTDGLGTPQRQQAIAVVNTQIAISAMLGLPANRTRMENLPGEQKLVFDWRDGNVDTPDTNYFSNPTPGATLPGTYCPGARVRFQGANYIALPAYPVPGNSNPSNTTHWRNTQGQPVSPLLLDGWGNPIIFVPASGIRVLLLGGKSTYDIADNEQRHIIVSPEGTVENNGTATPRIQRVGRPFFASAGPDGNFATGDDNIYSFEQ